MSRIRHTAVRQARGTAFPLRRNKLVPRLPPELQLRRPERKMSEEQVPVTLRSLLHLILAAKPLRQAPRGAREARYPCADPRVSLSLGKFGQRWVGAAATMMQAGNVLQLVNPVPRTAPHTSTLKAVDRDVDWKHLCCHCRQPCCGQCGAAVAEDRMLLLCSGLAAPAMEMLETWQ